ncbi:exodeoxyribonuclease III [Oceanobacillus jeddahense]|uniref:Exodeoxyribonuclease III n=1 Tax=Oceanobacillus jeddahense TaxID=1462527 RepID=A0ABY5JUM5_9BACI|nr:exodeoxyribonuclease III [Oceanobacillus jeddahense]UUI04053.1 exodeoxyribonuclease III [Oceanobacillus jeddahense]
MKLTTWNVNGIRACVRKGFLDFFHEIDADFFCLQETKLQAGQIELDLEGYYQYWNYAERKGYSGTAIFTKHEPLHVSYGFQERETEPEGRIITLEYPAFYLVNVYTPNSKRDLTRLEERLEWEDKMFHYLQELDAKKPVIYCGDLNVAHQKIDLKNDKTNHGNSGFTQEERDKMTRILTNGFTDTLRFFYPERDDIFTWWSYMKTIRERNIGWRIDYVIISTSLEKYLENMEVHRDTLGSDHCPVSLEINLDMA